MQNKQALNITEPDLMIQEERYDFSKFMESINKRQQS